MQCTTSEGVRAQVLSRHDQLLPEIPAKFVKRVGPTTQITQRQEQLASGGKEQQLALEQSKSFLKSSKLLVHLDDKKELTLACDASQFGLGAVLSFTQDGRRFRTSNFICI